jgi:DNA-binding NarL/FixJ family response regulator
MTAPAPRSSSLTRTIAVRKILVDHLAGLTANADLLRVIPALLAQIGPHLSVAPVKVTSWPLLGASEAAPTEHPLTPREVEVLQLVAAGLTNREIGLRLGVTTETVKTLVGRLLSRLGARDRAHAAAVGVRHGIIP